MFTISENEGIKTNNKKGFYSGNKYIRKKLYKNNNWKAVQGNSIRVIYNGLRRDKNKLPSKVKYINKNNIDVSTIEINNIFHV